MSLHLDEEEQRSLKRRLEALAAPVRLVFFTQRHPCATCREQQRLLEDLTELSDKLRLEIHRLEDDAELAETLGIDKVPGLAVLGTRDYGVRFFGVTEGYELDSLLVAMERVARGESDLPPRLEDWVRRIDTPLHLEILVTLTCPYCPRMVHLAHQLAIANDHIRADMVNAPEFPQLIQRYEVSGVPLTVVDGRPAFEGALPPEDAVLEILRLARPDLYETLDAELRRARGENVATEARPDEPYDVLVIGAGPAAVTAAIYAVRKDLRVAVLGDRPGGQINNTARIENWPGIPAISGQELAEMFRDHLEHYPVAERFHVRVQRVEKDGDGFAAVTETGERFRGHAVIYCAGKRYRTLGVPGEDRFIGRGIGFCATCDAPLYRGKDVAVIGGGNSAFTAARDLLPFARTIHLIHILDEFQADPVLVEEVLASPQVRVHKPRKVAAFLGKDKLCGVRLRALDSGTREDLKVDGVFIEIGLIPNSDPVKDLLTLNEHGEIPVDRSGATAVPGLFAAGDVTDEPEKQIVVAAGAGAKAALAAHRYLQATRPGEGS